MGAGEIRRRRRLRQNARGAPGRRNTGRFVPTTHNSAPKAQRFRCRPQVPRSGKKLGRSIGAVGHRPTRNVCGPASRPVETAGFAGGESGLKGSASSSAGLGAFRRPKRGGEPSCLGRTLLPRRRPTPRPPQKRRARSVCGQLSNPRRLSPRGARRPDPPRAQVWPGTRKIRAGVERLILPRLQARPAFPRALFSSRRAGGAAPSEQKQICRERALGGLPSALFRLGGPRLAPPACAPPPPPPEGGTPFRQAGLGFRSFGPGGDRLSPLRGRTWARAGAQARQNGTLLGPRAREKVLPVPRWTWSAFARASLPGRRALGSGEVPGLASGSFSASSPAAPELSARDFCSLARRFFTVVLCVAQSSPNAGQTANLSSLAGALRPRENVRTNPKSRLFPLRRKGGAPVFHGPKNVCFCDVLPRRRRGPPLSFWRGRRGAP